MTVNRYFEVTTEVLIIEDYFDKYLKERDVYSTGGMISIPFLSFALVMLNEANVVATMIHNDASAISWPGHALIADTSDPEPKVYHWSYLLPKPKIKFRG